VAGAAPIRGPLVDPRVGSVWGAAGGRTSTSYTVRRRSRDRSHVGNDGADESDRHGLYARTCQSADGCIDDRRRTSCHHRRRTSGRRAITTRPGCSASTTRSNVAASNGGPCERPPPFPHERLNYPHLPRNHFSPPVIVHIVCVRRPPAVLEHRTMGSYGYRWMQCSWCNVWGRVAWPVDTIQPPIVLFDVDGCGLICEPCYDRGWPPHALYVIHVLRRSRASLPTRVAELIAVYAYAAYAEATVVADQWY